MDLKHLIFGLLLYLCVGTFVSLGFVRESQLGRRYFIYHGLGAILLALTSYLILGREGLAPHSRGWLFAFLGAGTIYSVTAGLRRVVSLPAFVVASITGLVAIATDAISIPHAVMSSLLLGFALAAMLLGHWYLVQPKLSIDELGRVTLVLIGLIVIRFAVGTYSVALLVGGKSEAEIYRYFLSTTPGIFLMMRWTWGLLGPLILAYLIWGTVRIRSTQSATGILYVAVLAILTGEIMSHYLLRFHGIAS